MRSFTSTLRQLHLLAGLALALAVLYYTLSGAAVAYVRWFPGGDPVITTERIPLPPATLATENAAALRQFMEAEVAAHSRLQGVEPLESGGFRLRYQRPGVHVEALLPPGRSELEVTRTRYGLLRTLRGLHVMTGYGGGPVFIAWSLMLDLVSLAVIGFAVSGVYLWYRHARKRRLGWIVLVGSWGYTTWLVAYLYFS